MKFAPAADPLLISIRSVLILLGAGLGFLIAQAFFPVDSINRVYITILGALTASLFASRPSRWLRDGITNLIDGIQHTPPKTILAVTVATIAALLISVLLNNILSSVPGYGWVFQIGITLLLEALLVFVAVSNQDLFIPMVGRTPERNSGAAANASPAAQPKLLDTSVIIDGRVLEVAQTGFLEGPFVVPAFVLRELQFFADQSDSAKRAKGRRGLEVLERMQAIPALEFLVREFADTGGGVDERLVRAALEIGGCVVTNDNGLLKVAGLQGVKCLSLNALAEALKPRYGAGDELTVSVVKEGSQPGQGIGYLEDGTMVVVEDGMALRGRTVRVAVVSNIQTALGRMIFAKPKEVI